MAEPVLLIEERPLRRSEKARAWVRGRRIGLAAVLALVEVVVLIVWSPSIVLSTVAAALVMVLSIMGATRIRKGFLRDVLWIVGIAQAMVVVIPLALGLSVLAALLTAAALLVLLILLALRLRF